MVPFSAGRHLGDFEVGAPCDGGFRARELTTGRDARIKVLAHASDIDGIANLSAVQRVAHPNIARLLHAGVEDSVLYAVSEWVDGETLREKMAKGRLPIQKAVTYAAQIARGLSAAHRVGAVHSDLKPENIVIAKDGNVKLMDFGFAGLTDAEHAGKLVADYASPEQVRGEPEMAASDIFSLGVILHEMLSGNRPFLRPTLTAITVAILKANPPQELPPGVTPALARIVRHCMAKDAAERFASAADVAFALEAFWNLTIPHDKIRKLYKRGLTGVLLASAAGIVLGVGMGALIARRYLRPVAAPPLAFRHLTGSGHDHAPSASPDGKAIVYSSDRDGISRLWTMQLDTGQETPLTNGPDRFPRFSPNAKTVLFVRREGAADVLYSVPAAGGTPHKILSDVQSADWSPEGGIVWLRVTRSGPGYTSILGTANAAGLELREIARVEKQALAGPRCSPDGSLIAAVSGPTNSVHTSVFLTRAAGGGQQYLLAPPAGVGDLSALTWASDSENVLYLQSENRVSGNAWAGGGAHLIRQNAKTGGAAIIGFSQQNARLVDRLGAGNLVADSASRRENLEEIGLGREGREPRSITLGDITDQDPVYGPGGESIFFSSFRSGQLGVWELSRKTGATRRVIPAGSNNMEPALFSDGKRILWSSDREGHFEIYWADIANPHPRPITHNGVDAEQASITPDDGWVVYNSKNPAHSGVWKIRQTGLDDTNLAPGETHWPSVSPDGAFVLYTVDRGVLKRAVQVVTLRDGTRVGGEVTLDILPGSVGTAIGRAHWMPSGSAIAYIGQDERGRSGVYAQDFSPVNGPSGSRRILGGFNPARETESFAVSPDGAHLTVAALDQSTGIVEISNVPGMSAARR